MAENNKNHAPVAASLNLDDEAKSLYQSWQHSQPNRCSIPPWEKASESARAEWIEAANSRCTPPAEVSADRMPALPLPDVHDGDGPMLAGNTAYSRAKVLQIVAPYAEQIKKLARNQLPNLADGEDEVSFPGDGNVACTTEARYWELRAAEERVAELERELVERKQVQSIGGDPKFLDLLNSWIAQRGYYSYESSEVKKAWNALIAYIDARPAGTAPGMVTVPELPTMEMQHAAMLAARTCELEKSQPRPLPAGYELWSATFIYRAMIAAAPSLSTQPNEPSHFYTFTKPAGWINLLNPGQSWEEWTREQGAPTTRGWKVLGRSTGTEESK